MFLILYLFSTNNSDIKSILTDLTISVVLLIVTLAGRAWL